MRVKIAEHVKNVWSDLRKTRIKTIKFQEKGTKTDRREKKRPGKRKIKIEVVYEKLFDVIDDRKTEEVEMEFVRDQRSKRKMWIGGTIELCEMKEDIDEDDDEIVKYKEEMKKKYEKKVIEKRRLNLKREEKARQQKIAETKERSKISPNMAAQVINDVRASEGFITADHQEKFCIQRR